MNQSEIPRIQSISRNDGLCEIVLSGDWTLARLIPLIESLTAELARHAASPEVSWNCLAIEAMDSAGAMLLWRAWGRNLPGVLQARTEHLGVFEQIAIVDQKPQPGPPPASPFAPLMLLGRSVLGFLRHLQDFVALIGQLLLDFAHLFRLPGDLPQREIFANLYKSGVRAMPVTALVGFLIGVVLSYLSALQLKQLGAEIYIVNILGLGIIRELGPVLVALLVAGRSGSAMTAQLGVMRVTEEIDALATMGVSNSLRLIFPKVVALAVAMPLLVLWACSIAMIGSMVVAQVQLDISHAFFFDSLPKVVPIANLWIGLSKGFVFGILVALVACHFGLRVRPNTESLSANTTASVVTSITLVILVDAVFAIATRNVGINV